MKEFDIIWNYIAKLGNYRKLIIKDINGLMMAKEDTWTINTFFKEHIIIASLIEKNEKSLAVLHKNFIKGIAKGIYVIWYQDQSKNTEIEQFISLCKDAGILKKHSWIKSIKQ